MRRRLEFLIQYYFGWVLLFLVQKPLFIAFTEGTARYGFGKFVQVMWHGLPMDLSVAGYLTAIPFLAVLVSIWWPMSNNFNMRKVLRPYHVIIAPILAIIFVTDISLYPFWHYKLDASVFNYLASPKDAMASVSSWYIVIRVLAILVVAFIIYKHQNRICSNTFVTTERAPERKVMRTIVILCCGGLLFLAIRGGVKQSTMNVGRAYFSEDQYLNHSAVNPAFSLLSSIGKSTDFSKEYRFLKPDDFDTAMSQLFPAAGTGVQSFAASVAKDSTALMDTLLKTQRPNILLIEMESFGGRFINALGAPAEVAPNFNALVKEGIFFSNFFGNSYRTDRGTVSIFSGYPALPVVSLMKMPIIVRALPSLPHELVNQGYTTDFIYGGDINFTNTKGYLVNMDFQKITADVDFTKEERKTNSWGVNDHITFAYLAKELLHRGSNLAEGANGKPWFSAFLTLSCHEPFTVPYHRLPDKVYNAAAYTDDCLGRFIKQLKASPIWDNLLIILVPDHNITYNMADSNPDYFKCPMLWIGGAIKGKPRVISKFMNQSDIAATLLAQLGLPHNNFIYSRNILSGAYDKYPFAFSCFNNGFVFRDSTGVTSYDLAAKSVVTDRGKAELKDERLKKGRAILQSIYNNLYKYQQQDY
ncbi:MAG: sulfatase-like hydrolase/transferase [Bacteroidales bacterium]|jgi:phosphoglycerol transferase MdoB-like AlkP superfamily enzyme|nr:sulfatase-like hydrolase/transferase [Bacteroidales bacterium]MCI1733650.1 sulfatase-like hydrolase/transferase [Bacteroidales bacterium]